MSSPIDLTTSVLDVASIVQNLIYVDSAPVRQMQSQVTTLQSKVSAYQSLNTKLSTLADNVNSMLFGENEAPFTPPSAFADRLSTSVFSKCTVTSSNDDIISATAANSTAGGSYSLTVTSLAQARSIASLGFADVGVTTTGTGTITITSGSNAPVAITIDGTNNTLTGVRNSINSANAGVTATIINDGSHLGSPYRLLIRANETGTENSFTIDDSGLSGGQALGLSDPGAETQAAADAAFVLNGVNITKSTNTVSDVIEGVTFTLKKETTSPVTLRVERDFDSIVKALQEFVSAYNAVSSSINSQFSYNAATKSAGVLSGDSTLRRIQSNLQSQITQSIANQFTSYGVVGQTGLEFNRDGSLTLDESKFRKALSDNFTGVAGLFVGEGSQNILVNLSSVLDGITDPLSGPIHNATDGLNKNIDALNDNISAYQERLDKEAEMLTQIYSEADEALRLLGVNQSTLGSLIDSLSSK